MDSAPGSPVKFPGLPSAPLPPSSLGVASTLAPSLPPDLSTVIASLSPAQSPVARSKDGLIRMLLQSGEAVAASDPLAARLISLIQLDHSYSKPWNWRPESSFCQPTRTLFVPRVNRPGPGLVETDHDSCDEDGGLLDVVSESVKRSPMYDVEKAKKLMLQCERFTCFTRPSLASLNSEEEESEDEEMAGWEERIVRDNWSAAQSKLFGKVMKVLGQDRLSRLATDGADQEPILRRLSVDKSAKRMRAVLAAPPCVWDRSLVQWLHNTLSTFLPRPLLSAWLDILQSLRAKIPVLMERILAGAGGHHIDPKARSVAQEGLLLLLRRPWDPVEGSLASRRLARLPGNPIILVAPPGPEHKENKSISARMKFWNTQLGCLGKVVILNMPPPRGESAQRTGVNYYLHQMVSATLNKVREFRQHSGDRPVIVVGWGPGAAIAAHVASIERLGGLVCLGFPVSTLAGVRGQVGDTLLDLKTPALFVVGERSSQCNTDDIEDIREKMTVETGLVIVGGADDQLRLTNKKKRAELVTQTMVDKNIIEQIRTFLVGILIKQTQAAMERDSRSESTFAVPGQEGSAKKMKARKRLGGGELGSASPQGKKFKASTTGSLPPAPLSPGGTPLLMINKAVAKKTRRPKKLKMPETEGFTLSSGSITPLPASLLSISTPLPPVSGAGKDAGDPPPLPIRIPGLPVCSASSPTPRVIQYAAAGSKSEALKVTNNPTTPTWSVAMSRPVTAARPSSGQLLLSSFHRNLSPTKLVTGGGQVSPRGPGGTVQIQLPSPGMIRGQGQLSPEKLLILMSPGKEGHHQPPRISPGSGKIVMAATSPGRSVEASAVSRVLLQGAGLKPEAARGLVFSPAPGRSLSPTKPASGAATPTSSASPSGSAAVSPRKN